MIAGFQPSFPNSTFPCDTTLLHLTLSTFTSLSRQTSPDHPPPQRRTGLARRAIGARIAVAAELEAEGSKGTPTPIHSAAPSRASLNLPLHQLRSSWKVWGLAQASRPLRLCGSIAAAAACQPCASSPPARAAAAARTSVPRCQL